jgi:cellulose biosynthesis protein BcsQ
MTTFKNARRAIAGPRNIIIWSGKGGVGKTTTGQNIAWWLAAAGRKVALVDTDSHPNSGNFVDQSVIPVDRWFTLTHVIQQEKALLDAMYQVRKGLYVIPSDTNIEAANGHIIANEAQEVMIDRYHEMTAALSPCPEEIPAFHSEPRLAPAFFPELPFVGEEEILERPAYLDYLIWDFGAEPGPLGKAILRMPNCEIWSPVVLEPLPLQAFAQMKDQLNKVFKNHPESKPPIRGVFPYKLTHKKEETVEEFVKLYVAHKDVFMRPIHEDLNVPPTQNFYPARAIYEVNSGTRAARELFEIAMRIDGYQGQFKKSPTCKHCNEIYAWLQQELMAGEGA